MKREIPELHFKAVDAVKDFRKSESDLLDILCECEKNKIYLIMGFPSLYKYCVSLGLTEAQSYAFMAVVRKSEEIPELKTEIQKGELSVFKAQRIISVIKPENKTEWIDKAKNLSKREIEIEVAAVNPEEFKRKEIVRSVSAERTRVSIEIDEEVLKDLRRIQGLLSSKKRKRVELEEVLREISEEYLNRKDPKVRAEAGRKKKTPNGVHPVSENQKATLPGHSLREIKRTIPAATKHLIWNEAKGECSFHGADGTKCAQTTGLQIHHCEPWAQGGKHEPENLKLLCRHHHRLTHLTFQNPVGSPGLSHQLGFETSSKKSSILILSSSA